MIGNTFNSLISTNSQLLLQAEEQVRGAVSKDFKTQIYSKLPTQESIKQQFLTEGQNIENAEDIKNLENLYLRLKTTCDSLMSTVDNKTNQLNAIKGKTQGIQNNFNKLTDAIGIVTPLITTAKTIITAAKIGLNALPVNTPVGAPIPGSGGGAIIKLSDSIKESQGKIKEFESILKLSGSITPFILGKVSPINLSVDQALVILNTIKATIDLNCQYLESIYSYVLAHFTDIFAEEGIDDSNSPNEDDIPNPNSDSNQDNESIPTAEDLGIDSLEGLLEELNPNISRDYIEYLKSESDQLTTPDGGKRSSTGYQYKKNKNT